MKLNRVDILIQDQQQRYVIIEIQNCHISAYLERILFGTSKMIVNNVKSGEDSNQNIKLINISTRAPIKGGADNVVAGFIITGEGTQKIVLRGWGLENGVDPKLQLQKKISDTQWEVIATNNDWQTDSRHAEIPNYMTASFEANDAALLLDLPAGVYTVTLSSVGANGLGLVGVDAID